MGDGEEALGVNINSYVSVPWRRLDQLFSRTDDDYIYATRHMSPPELRQRLGGRFSRLVHPWTSFVVLVLVLVLMLMPVLMSALVLVRSKPMNIRINRDLNTTQRYQYWFLRGL